MTLKEQIEELLDDNLEIDSRVDYEDNEWFSITGKQVAADAIVSFFNKKFEESLQAGREAFGTKRRCVEVMIEKWYENKKKPDA